MNDSLRLRRVAPRSTATDPLSIRRGAGFATTCAVTLLAGTVSAQDADTGAILLPPVDIQTTEAAVPTRTAPPQRTAVPVRRAPAAPTVCTSELAGTPVCAAQEAAEAAAAAEAARVAAEAARQARAGSNPNADPNAPFKADRLTNSKLSGEIRDMPRTVTAITKETLETTHTTSVREIARQTPGMSLGFGEGGNAYGDNIYIRGFKANNDVYVDGVRDPGTSVRETFDTEQVEVLKGPSGSVGGRGATGGTINIATKQPQDVDFTHLTVEATSAGTLRTTVDQNLATNDRVQLRFNGLFQDGMVAGRDHVTDDRYGAAAAIRYKLSDDVTLDGSYSFTKFEGTPDWGVPFTTSGPDGASGPVTEFGVDRATFYGIPDRDFQKAERHVATGRLTWDLGGTLQLANTLRAARTINDYILTAPGSVDENGSTDPDDWTTGVRDKSKYQVTEVLSNTTELTGEADWGGMDHSFVAGVLVQKEHVSADSYPGSTEDFPVGSRGCTVDVVNPDTSVCFDGNMPGRNGTPTKTDVKTVSAYVVDRIGFAPGWTLDAGLRVDHYDISRISSNGAELSRMDTMWNGNLGLSYKPSEALTFYAAAATSTNPMGQEIAAGGGFYGGLDTGGAGLKPERNIAFELGTKYELTDHLLLTAALFQTTKKNAREDVGPRGSSVTHDTLEYRLRGVELGVSGKVDRLGLYGGAVFMESEILKSMDSANEGEEIATIAHQQFNLLATYDVTDQLMLGVQSNWKGEVKLGTLTPNDNRLPSYWAFDLVGSYDVNERLDVRFGVKNATDKTYYDTAYRSGEPFTYVAPGREIWAAVDVKF
ncbi:TonB-dependent receptor [Sagittula salina]|uniref:TonB-dependent siderophore receptor n=1 Tax=Sagittula salina TaxID=2820268 RepID=A0A940MNZ1_9RHOB|nr:TonB-dependent siderophore receptor [Sagittula salina]MBP0482799.1 TonB-dependent siderophore receptor [Sagittula salina]